MSRLITIVELSKTIGISVTSIRRRVSNGTIPYTRANTITKAGKLLFNEELVQEVLRQENLKNLHGCYMGEDTQEPKAKPTSYLAGLFGVPSDKIEAAAERDKRLGHVPMNTNKSGSFSK